MSMSNWSLGLLFIFIVAIIWAGSSVLLQFIFDDLQFRSPFLVTYVENSLFSIYLPIYIISRFFGCIPYVPLLISNTYTRKRLIREEKDGFSQLNEDSSHHYSKEDSDSNSSSSTNSCGSDDQVNFSHESCFRLALIIFPIWFFSNCLYNYSLLMTTVSSSTIISNLSGPFTLFCSWMAGLESSSWMKWGGIIVGLAGVWLVAYNDEESNSTKNKYEIYGDLVALASAMGYGFYTTVLKKLVPEDDGTLMQLMLGYMGLISAFFLLPILVVLIIVGYIDLSHLTPEVILFLLIGGYLDNALSDYLWARSVVLTSPTVATVGLGLTIPLAIVSDAVLGKETPSIMECSGAALVLVGFLIINSYGEQEQSAGASSALEDIGNPSKGFEIEHHLSTCIGDDNGRGFYGQNEL